MYKFYQIAIICTAFILFSFASTAAAKINLNGDDFLFVNQVETSADNMQDQQKQQDKKGQNDQPKPQTAKKEPTIVIVPKARKQSRPKVVKPKVNVKPIKVIKPKIKKP